MLSITPFPAIETPRLSLRETRFDDAPAIFRILCQPEVVRHYNIGPLADIDEARAIVTHRRQSHFQGTRIRWTIVLKENDQVIGSCGYVNPDSRARQAEIGYELDTAFWGKGLMREALTAMLSFGFGVIGLHRIEALVVPENEPSGRLLSRLGFRQEGLLRERGFWKDAFYDLALYAMLDREWADLANGNEI